MDKIINLKKIIGSLNGGDCLEDLSVDGGILKWILGKQEGSVCPVYFAQVLSRCHSL